jgi:glycosyltransferase involved in cell wall biosynthesis
MMPSGRFLPVNCEDTNLVSVVIACYNHEKYLSETIESVLAQTYGNLEVIVVDDGSTDRSWDVAQRFSSVRCIKQENAGTPAATRNRGLHESRGQYVVFLDGDDRLLPRALEIGVRQLQSRPDDALTVGRCKAIGDGRCLTTFPLEAEFDPYRALLIKNYILTPGSVIFRTAVVKEFEGFDASLEKRGVDDYDLYLRIALKWPICYHEEMVLEYREHESNLSKNLETMFRSTLTVLHAQKSSAKQNPSYKVAFSMGMAFWRDWYGEQVVDNVRDHVRQHRWRQAFEGIQFLSQYCPRLILRHVVRKTYCVVFGIRSDRVST